MNLDEFWSIVDRVHAAAPKDMERKCRLLAEELRKLTPSEVRSFDAHFTSCYFRAYTKDLWGAAFVIKDGCGADRFMDFRSTLISMGRATFEAALADAESLAESGIERAWVTYQGYQSVPYRILEEMASRLDSESEPHRSTDSDQPRHPKQPAGEPFEPWAMSARFPKLVAKFAYKDSAWLPEKRRIEKEEERRRAGQALADLWLDLELIPPSGWIPPLRVARSVLRQGRAREITARTSTWQPFELQETDYWTAVVLLERLPAEELRRRPHLRATRLKLDVAGPETEDYAVWLRSLAERGLME